MFTMFDIVRFVVLLPFRIILLPFVIIVSLIDCYSLEEFWDDMLSWFDF